MKNFVFAIALAVALSGWACGSVLVLPGTTLAYDFSPAERELADNPTLHPSNSVPQWQRDQQQVERLQQERERDHNSIPQFNPSDFNPTNLNPYNLYQPGGRALVCRHGANNAVHCY